MKFMSTNPVGWFGLLMIILFNVLCIYALNNVTTLILFLYLFCISFFTIVARFLFRLNTNIIPLTFIDLQDDTGAQENDSIWERILAFVVGNILLLVVGAMLTYNLVKSLIDLSDANLPKYPAALIAVFALITYVTSCMTMGFFDKLLHMAEQAAKTASHALPSKGESAGLAEVLETASFEKDES
jgi:hypothetical protein